MSFFTLLLFFSSPPSLTSPYKPRPRAGVAKRGWSNCSRPTASYRITLARLGAVEARSRLQIHANLQDVGRLLPKVETTLYRIAQEALNNVMKHAQASQVWVSLQVTGDSVVITVRDDGVGFDKAQLPSSGGLGLDGMSERAVQIGADLRIDSEPGRGYASLS